MAEIIATIWDFDKTLIPCCMQQPIFDTYNYQAQQFWEQNRDAIEKLKNAGYEVNHETHYLNQLIDFSQKGMPFDGLNNEQLEALGAELPFYEGAVELFDSIVALEKDSRFKEFGIKFENYIVSTGLIRMIKGSKIYQNNRVKRVWGAELIDEERSGKKRLVSIAYSLDNTTKTRAIFEINKGVGLYKDASIDVNSKITEEERRVQFCNMVYVADGPSDVPAFSLIEQKGGATLAVYPRGDRQAFAQVEQLRKDGRVQMIAEACYKKDSTAEMWLMNKLREQAETLINEKKKVFRKPPGTPSFA